MDNKRKVMKNENVNPSVTAEEGKVMCSGNNAENVNNTPSPTNQFEENAGNLDSSGLYSILFKKSPVAYQSLDENGNILEVNDAWLNLLGYTREEVISRNYLDFLIPEHKALFANRFPIFKESGFVHGADFEMVCKDGIHVYVSAEGSSSCYPDGRFKQSHCVLLDMTDRKRMEDELRKQKEDYETIFHSVPGPIFCVDRYGICVKCNKASSESLGMPISQIEGRTYADIVPQEAEIYLQDNAEVMSSGVPKVDIIRPYHSVSGKSGWVRTVKVPYRDNEGHITGVISLSEDMTERRALEQQLNQRQKMEELGFLAGGVAHDFNNLLTVIMGFSELARDNAKDNAILKKYLDNIIQATDRAANLTHQLLAFAHQQVIEPKVVFLNDLTMDMEKMLRRLIGEKIELISRYDPNLWNIVVDPGQYEQIILNLAVNARDAMPDGGVFTMETKNIHLEKDYTRLHPAVPAGDYVQVSISDTGHGIPEDIIPQIFKPFYTTKPKGKGTGLGLSTCYGIMKQSNGIIDVESELGRGATFHLYFPRALDMGSDTSLNLSEEQDASGEETILLVEDEEMVSETAKLSLSTHGYQILCASDGIEALEIFHDRRDEIDLIISDVVMPRMGGRELLDRIRDFDSHIPFILASGYTDHLQIVEQLAEKGAYFIHKPYTPISLVRMVREVLDITSTGDD